MPERFIFADANSNYSEAAFIIFGAPFDGTSCFRKGSRLAPDAIREVSYNFETYNPYFDIDLEDVPVHDAGNIPIQKGCTVDQALASVATIVSKILIDGKVPIMLGGEHSLTISCIRESKNRYSDLGAVVLDAHMDLRDVYEGEINSHACVNRRIIEDVTDKFIAVGIRSGSREEYSLVKARDITYYSADRIIERGIAGILNEMTGLLDTTNLYLSLDMDAIDPAFAPALGTPEPFGLTDRQVLSLVRWLAPLAVGFDVTEIAPQFDSGNTAMLGGKYVREFIASAWASRQ